MTTGSRVFVVVKGASEGGIFIPHSDKRFPGYDTETRRWTLNAKAKVLKKYIFGGHASEYTTSLEEDERYWYLWHSTLSFKRQFSTYKYIAHGVESDDIAEIYEKAHAAIWENPMCQYKTSKLFNAKQAFKAKIDVQCWWECYGEDEE
jgi:hypothetical protein